MHLWSLTLDSRSSCQGRTLRRMVCLGMFLCLVGVPICVAHAESLQEKVQKAFSPVGEWTITQMDVVLAGGTAASGGAQVDVEIRSTLGGPAHFMVHSDGEITGEGIAHYRFRVEATSKISLPFPISIPVGGTAKLSEAGERHFTISGRVNLAERVISLNAFQPAGDPLQVIVRPGGGQIQIPAWPPMTNVEAGILVQGASLVLQARGTVGKFQLALEAVKYVDLVSVFESIAERAQKEETQKEERAQKEETQKEETQKKESKREIKYKDGVNKDAVSNHSKTVLERIMKKAGVDSITISDTTRTVEDQVNRMYDNTERLGVDHQKELYGPAGDKVIDTYSESKKAGKSEAEIKADMQQTLKDIRSENPSAFRGHVGDPSSLNVIDISPRSIPEGQQEAFKKAIEEEQAISQRFVPPQDPAYHIEIPQP